MTDKKEKDLAVTSPRRETLDSLLKKKLKIIPEQDEGYSAWELSAGFCALIDRFDYYFGVVLEGGEKVNLRFMEAYGFKSTLPLDAYLKGAVYAKLQGKYRGTDVPDMLRFRFQQKMQYLLQQEILPFASEAFHCSSYEQLKKREEEND